MDHKAEICKETFYDARKKVRDENFEHELLEIPFLHEAMANVTASVAEPRVVK